MGYVRQCAHTKTGTRLAGTAGYRRPRHIKRIWGLPGAAAAL